MLRSMRIGAASIKLAACLALAAATPAGAGTLVAKAKALRSETGTLTGIEARLDWPLPEAAESQLLALAESAQSELAAAWGSPDLAHRVFVRRRRRSLLRATLPVRRRERRRSLWRRPQRPE